MTTLPIQEKNIAHSCITIYTDASVCLQTKAAGWACWVKNGINKATILSGKFKNPIKCPTEAELMAIVNALVAVKKLHEPKNNILIIVTDSLSAQRYISHVQSFVSNKKLTRSQRDKNIRRPQNHLWDLAIMAIQIVPEGCYLKVNKVKAHSKKDGVRSYVNDLVDKAAKQKMREARKQGE